MLCIIVYHSAFSPSYFPPTHPLPVKRISPTLKMQTAHQDCFRPTLDTISTKAVMMPVQDHLPKFITDGTNKLVTSWNLAGGMKSYDEESHLPWYQWNSSSFECLQVTLQNFVDTEPGTLSCGECDSCKLTGICEREFALGRPCPCGGCDDCTVWEQRMPLQFRQWFENEFI